MLAILPLLEVPNLGRIANFFYEFICIYIYFLYICIVIFKPLILVFMHNSLIFTYFLAFLNEEGVLFRYLKARFEDSCFSFDDLGSFFKDDPSCWISTAFLWTAYKQVDWNSVNVRWLTHLALIKKNLKNFHASK